jgi:hypothetical protein
MATQYANGKIVTDGLVLSLDAADRNSYVSGSLVWNDVSGNGNAGTLTNGPTFDSGSGGNIVFDGVNDYLLMSRQSTFTTELTYCGFIYPTNLTGNRAIFSFRGTLLQVQGNGIVYWANITNSSALFTATGLNLNQWNFISISHNNNQVTAYYNSNNLGTVTLVNPLTSYSYNEIARFGEGDRQFAGSLGNFLFYNRALSAQEVLQNYNAQKSRFGLK